MVEGSAPAQAGFDAASQNTLNGAPVEIADYPGASGGRRVVVSLSL